MSGSTTELNLRTAVDSDDNADYLTLDLANSLRTVDALFNNVTGHNHGGAHQGGPLVIGAGQIADGSISSAKIADGSITTVDLADASVTSAKLSPPVDIAGYFRTTGAPVLPSTGVGLEMYWSSGQGGVVQVYNHDTTSYGSILVIGNTIELRINSTPALKLNADASTTLAGPLTLNTGSVYLGTTTQIMLTNDGNNIFYRSTAAGNHFFQHTDGSYAGILVNTVTAQGTISAPSITFNQSGYFWQGIAGIGAVETNGNVQVDGGVVYFHANRTVYLQLSGTGLILGGFTAMTLTGVMNVSNVVASGTATNTFAGDITLAVPRQISFGGGELIAPGENISRANTVFLSPHAYVFSDLGVGHNVTCQQLIQTSDPRLKAGATVIPDSSCMTRIRGNVPVYSYQLTPPDTGGDDSSDPTPTPTDIGFMADDVHANSPEFSALDDQGAAVGVSYSNMAALLWGALRDLDARCQAKGI